MTFSPHLPPSSPLLLSPPLPSSSPLLSPPLPSSSPLLLLSSPPPLLSSSSPLPSSSSLLPNYNKTTMTMREQQRRRQLRDENDKLEGSRERGRHEGGTARGVY
ncbi:hypothetical protein BDQ17DRAFT_1430713 [Cyathus striatus]|nr:hypothetical protein BDQ17DRAFT_1430713 [Cyathus striatus]